MADFTASIQLNSNKGLGYLGKADCFRYVGNFKEAIKMYTKAIQSEQAVSNAAMLKKSIAYFESKQYDDGLKDLNKVQGIFSNLKLLEVDPSNSEAYYFKGLCKLKLNNP
jgi:tetratricopeptide (TPR) repeat protein